jgi:alpha-N-arabinofuranosidase
MQYQNPILPGFYPDPSVCRAGEDYYLVTSSFEYFPGVPIFHSRNLINWRQIGHCLTRKSQLNLDSAKSSGGIYAPTIRQHEGKFYVVTTDTTGIGNFFVWAEDPAGPWSEPIPLKQGGIDPSLFFDGSGRVYLSSNCLFGGRRGLQQSEIDISTGTLLSAPRFIWAGTGGKYPEAPHLYLKDGWFFLLAAEGGTEFGHMITVARSRDPFGPFEACPYNPILSHRSTSHSIQSTGHGDIFQDHLGDWWMFFLGVRHNSYPLVHHLGRETYLAPITWSADGWPVVNGGCAVELEITVASSLSIEVQLHPPVRTDFEQDSLELYWNFRRNPVPESWTLRERPGWLGLRCLPASLDDVAPLSFIGRRQQHFSCTASALIEFSPSGEHEEAGLTVLMNEAYRCDVFVSERNGKKSVSLRRRIGSVTVDIASQAVCEGAVILWIKAGRDWYTLGYTEEGAGGRDTAPVTLGRAETRHLSTEIAGGFTGVYFGLYATSSGQASQVAAWFDWFEYAPSQLTGDDPIVLQPVTAKPRDDAAIVAS